MSLSNLPTLAEVQAARAFKPCPKGATRLQLVEAERKLTTVDEKAFRAEVAKRDKNRCRVCGRKVLKTISRIPERAEVHHLHGRLGALRHEARAAILVCLKDHERLTGKVNEKLVAVASATFTTKQGTFTDARKPIEFRKAA